MTKAQDNKVKLNGLVSVKLFGVKGDGSTDDGPAIRTAMASGLPLYWPSGTYLVSPDPASAFNDGGNTRFSYSLAVPSNSVWHMEQGAVIKQANGSQSWTRTVSFQNADNVRVFGELNVDANVANVGTPTNEQMHGVYLFNTTNSYFERIVSKNARGDNVFIGGSDENTKSVNVHIGSIYAVKAGRKNLVLQYFDNIRIDNASLDNTAGGASSYPGGIADDTDKHSLDLEPDTYTGAQWMRASIGSVFTKGTGNDFTAGTTDVVGRKCVLNIDTFVHEHTSSTVRAWMQNACTVNVNTLRMTGLAGVTQSILLQYSAYLNVENAYFEGTTPAVSDALMLMAVVSNQRPRVSFGQLYLINTVGAGIENRDSDLKIGKYRGSTAGIPLWARCTSSTAGIYADTNIEELEMADVGQPLGAGYAVLHSASGSQIPLTYVQRVRFTDSRTPKLNFIFSVGSGTAAGISVGVIDNATTVTNFQFSGTDKFYRHTGGGGFPAVYTGTGTPESMVTAPVGSIFFRTDGGAGTSFYVKQTGTGNTGWVGK